MHTLAVNLFGGVRVSLDGKPVASFPTRWSAGLFAYLAFNKGHSQHRDVLTSFFWPEEPDQRARKCLRNALWRVRSLLEPPGIPAGTFLSVTRRDVGLKGESVWLDVAEFDARIAAFREGEGGPKGIEGLEEGVRLFRGHFMDGYDYEWCVYERERLRLALLTALEHLLNHHMERGEWSLAIQRGRAVLREDPFREHVHRCLMACHHFMGNRALAIRQYQECARVLEEEMGLAPMEATLSLYREIQRDSPRLDPSRGAPLILHPHRSVSEVAASLTRVEEVLSELRRLAAQPHPHPGQ